MLVSNTNKIPICYKERGKSQKQSSEVKLYLPCVILKKTVEIHVQVSKKDT